MTASSHIGRWIRQLPMRIIRVAVVSVVVWALAQLVMEPARADMNGQMHQFGQVLIEHATSLAGGRAWLINDARVGVESRVTESSVAEVIDQAVRGCQASEVLRGIETEGGFAACVRGAGPMNDPTAMVRHIAAGAGFDIDGVGLQRFVYARRIEDRTHSIVLSADQPLSMTELFATQPASTSDLPGVFVPGGIDRVFSFREVGRPYGFAVYQDHSRTPAELERDFADTLRTSGWRTFERYGGSGASDERAGTEGLMAVRGGHLAVLVVFGRADYSVAGLAVTAIDDDEHPSMNF